MLQGWLQIAVFLAAVLALTPWRSPSSSASPIRSS